MDLPQGRQTNRKTARCYIVTRCLWAGVGCTGDDHRYPSKQEAEAGDCKFEASLGNAMRWLILTVNLTSSRIT